MTKHLQILILLCLLIFEDAFSQNNISDSSQNCKRNLLEFTELVKEKDYEKAYEPWFWTFENCPEYSRHIYTNGLKIVENRYKKKFYEEKEIEGKLIDSIFAKRIQYFPKNLGKIYSNWAISLRDRGASKDEVFEKLELAFKEDATDMSVKNLALYFKEVAERNKDTDPQKVYDSYDDVMDAVNDKMDLLSVELDALNKKATNGETLTAKERLKRKNIEINQRGLSQIELILDQTLGPVATCERLIPLYKENFEANKNDAKWLKRAVSRMYHKECTEDDLYLEMVEAWRVANELNFAKEVYTKLFPNENSESGWLELRNRIEVEKDPYIRAKHLLKIAYIYKNKNKSTARSYAYKALEARPNYGDAYLLIAGLYASSANNCGTTEFEKRLVYVAAADKARKAKEVDPSVTAKADRFIEASMKNTPGKRTSCFPSRENKNKTSFQINCWIGETVTYNPYKN